MTSDPSGVECEAEDLEKTLIPCWPARFLPSPFLLKDGY